ncbi:MAG: hypothetical protein HZA62_16115 [Rhodocyclales bacterium]|nr:hypothetical protein [Rhodocyclales bacterium]
MWFVSEEDEQRFGHALLASLLVHLLVLGYVKGVEPLRKPGYGGALTVNFRASAAVDDKQGIATPPPVAVPAPPAATPAMTQAQTLAPPLPASKPRPQPPPAASRIGMPQRAAAPERAAENGVRGTRVASSRGPGVVDVLLVIGADGHPQGIYWDVLPALTRAQFEQLEGILRRQVYASSTGARLTQEIDVFGLLGIGRAPIPVTPAPTAEGLPAQ